MPNISIILPWPSSDLSPNSRSTWNKINAVKAARYTARCATVEAGNPWMPGERFDLDCRLKVSFIFHPPDRKYRDLDNMVSMCKAYADGIFEALQNNDNQIDTIEARKKDVVKGGSVTIMISEVDENGN